MSTERTAAVRFPDHTAESAPEKARAMLRASERQMGFTAAALARMAESPPAVEGFFTMLRLVDHSSLPALEREVLVMTLARTVGCDVCVAIHTAALARLNADPDLTAALRAQTPLADARLETVRQFTLAVIERRGDVSDAQLAEWLAAGFTREQALDVVVGVATYTLSTYANRMTRAPLDAPLAGFRFESAEEAATML